MPKGLRFRDYIKAAFSAKPWGMAIPPNWMMLGGFGMLTLLVSPAFLLIGAGCELAYMFALSTNRRFQKYVLAIHRLQDQTGWQQRLQDLLGRLWPDARKRFQRLQERCGSVMEFYFNFLNVGPDLAQHHNQSLNKFAWIFLQLLLTKQAISKIVKENSYVDRLQEEITELEKEIQDPGVTPDLKKSLESKRDIIKQRLDVLSQAENKLKYIDSELDRIEQQVELIREQAVISKDSQTLSTKIDLVSTSLGETTDWIKEQQSLFGSVQELVDEPPPILVQPTAEKM